ncbi:MAG: hypothetical protein ACLFSE_11725 [Spirochaetia bacterium]
MSENRGEIVIYTDADGSVQTEVRLEAESLWATQNQLEKLFDTDRTSIVKHIRMMMNFRRRFFPFLPKRSMKMRFVQEKWNFHNAMYYSDSLKRFVSQFEKCE